MSVILKLGLGVLAFMAGVALERLENAIGARMMKDRFASAVMAGNFKEAIGLPVSDAASDEPMPGRSITPMQFATQQRDLAIVRHLAARGAVPDRRGTDATPSPYELARDDPELLGAVLAGQVKSFSACNADGVSPWLVAAGANDVRMLTMMLSAGVSRDARCTADGPTALDIAQWSNAQGAVELLTSSPAERLARVRKRRVAQPTAPGAK
jgi:hypothetical protein